MKSKLLLATLVLAVAFNGWVVADEAFDKVSPVRVLKVALNLDAEQVTALRELIKNRAAEVKPVNQEIHELQAQLEELLNSGAPDQMEVGGLVLDIQALKQEIAQGHEVYQQSFRDLLTPLQIERLRNINKIAIADRAGEVLHTLKLH